MIFIFLIGKKTDQKVIYLTLITNPKLKDAFTPIGMNASRKYKQDFYLFNSNPASFTFLEFVPTEIFLPVGHIASRQGFQPSRGRVEDFQPLLLLKNPHIIHNHSLWEDRCRIGRAGKISANRDVEDEKERLIEGIGLSVQICRGDGVVKLVVHIPLDLVFFPDDGKDVEFLGEFLSGRQKFRGGAKLVLAEVSAEMRRADDAVGAFTGQLHDVNFAAGWPAGLVNIFAQHPQRRPEALAFGQYGADVNPAIFKFPLVFGNDARGGVIFTSEIFLFCFDDHVASGH